MAGGWAAEQAGSADDSEHAEAAPIAGPVHTANCSSVGEAFTLCSDAVYRFILQRVGDRTTADEILQESCHQAMRRGTLPLDSDRMGAWLTGIARNLIRKHWRNQRRDRRNQPLDEASAGRELLDRLESSEVEWRDDDGETLLRAVTALAAAEQRLIIGAYFEGRCYEDLAAESRTTAKAIEAKLYRIRAKLRELLRDPTKTGDV